MKKELLEENTKTRWKKLAGINEGRGYYGDTTKMLTKKGVIVVVTKEGGLGQQESEEVLIIGKKNPTMSSDWMYSWQWPADAEPGQAKITGELSSNQVGWNEYEGFYLEDDATYKQIRGDIRQAKLTAPLSPEEEANLQSADEMPSSPTVQMPRGVAEGKKLKVRK